MRARSLAVIVIFLAGSIPAWAYEEGFLDLRSPSQLQQGDLDLLFEHRFYGSVLDNPLQNLFGLAIGANVGFGGRWMILPGLQARALYTTDGQDLSVGAGYGHWFEGMPLGLQADVELVSPAAASGRGYGAFVALSAEAGPVLKVLSFDLEAAWDTYLSHLGTAVAVRWDATPWLAVIAEVSPFFLLGTEQHPEQMGTTTAFSAGAMLTIGGHQFSLLAGNSFAMGDRRLMAGAPGLGGIYLGFNIQRRFP